MQAIHSKYIPATNTRPSRIKAECDRGSITISYPHELNAEQGHIHAVNLLIAKFLTEEKSKYGTPAHKNPWNKQRFVGQLKNGWFVHVYAD